MRNLLTMAALAMTLHAIPCSGQVIEWQQTLSGTGDVWSIATDPSGIVLAATDNGVYRSTDGGRSWTFIGFSPSVYAAAPEAVAIDPSSHDLFVGLGAGGAPNTPIPGSFGGGGSGVYRSSDGGTTWTPWSVGNPGVFGLTVTPAGSVIAASSGPTGGNGGLFLSPDDGGTWTYGDCCYPRSFAVTSTGIFAGGTYVLPGVFRSTDAGVSWSLSGLSNVIYALAAGANDRLFAGTPDAGIYSSSDGVTWTQANNVNSPVTALSADSFGNVFAGVFGIGVLDSSDEGTSWTPDNNGLTDLRVQSLAIGIGQILAGTPSGIFRQTGFQICALYDQNRSVKSGAVFPIKLELCDANGNDLSSSAIIVHAVKMTAISGFSGDPEAVGNANPDDDFRFDSTLGTGGGYIFNLSTSGLASGTYSLQFTAGGDPFMHSVNFGVR